MKGSGALANVSVEWLPGIPEVIKTGARGLKMDTYNRLIEYLGESEK